MKNFWSVFLESWWSAILTEVYLVINLSYNKSKFLDLVNGLVDLGYCTLYAFLFLLKEELE